MPHTLRPLQLLYILIASIVCVTLADVAMASISVDATQPGSNISNYLYGTNIPWPREGMGLLQTDNKTVKLPVAFNQMAVDKAAQMKVSLLRFGGGEVYNWRDGVGPNRPQRKPNGVTWVSANDVGTDEFINFCRTVGAEPIICVPLRATRDFSNDSAPLGDQLAANWVEYCNGKSPGLAYGKAQGWQPTQWQGVDPNKTEVKVAGSYLSTDQAPDGYFAWLREYFGHPQPYGVRYWEIGNEIYLFGPQGAYSNPKPWAIPAAYAAALAKFSAAMKAEDPTIQIGADTFTSPAGGAALWNAALFGTKPNFTPTLQTVDFLILHEYIGPQAANPASPATEYQQLFQSASTLESQLAALRDSYGKPLMITEYNVQYGVFGGSDPKWIPHQHHLKSGLTIALMQNAFHRVGVFGACQFHFMDIGAWYQSDLWRMVFDDTEQDTGRHRTGVTPTFLVLDLYSNYGRGNLLPATVTSQPDLDAIAVRAQPGGQLRLFVVNKSATQADQTTITLSGFTPAAGASVYTVNSPNGMESYNEASGGPQVTIATTSLPSIASTFTYSFPAHSLTVLDIPAPAAANSQLQVRSSASSPAPQPGDVVTYTTVCTNTGTTAITQSQVQFSIPPNTSFVPGSDSPAGAYSAAKQVITWTVTNLGPGQSQTFTCNVTVR